MLMKNKAEWPIFGFIKLDIKYILSLPTTEKII